MKNTAFYRSEKQSTDENVQYDRYWGARWSGVPDIYAVWEAQGWKNPMVEEQYDPDRTILMLAFTKKQAEKTAESGRFIKTIENKKSIISFLETEGDSKAADIAEHLGLSPARTRVLLSELVDEGKVQVQGNGRSRRYGL